MSSSLRTTTFPAILALLALGPILGAQQGCETEDPYDPGAHTEEHACVHFEEGPVEPIRASTSPSDAPELSEHHTRYDIEMVSYEGGLGGFATFYPDEHGVLLIFADQPAEIQLLDENLNPLGFEDERLTSDACTAIGARYVAHVNEARYFLEFGPGGAPAVLSLAIEEGEDSH